MFLHPLGLLALLGVPAIVALHLFRRRFRPEPVSALFLWIDEDDTLMSGRRRERLRTGPSFWCEVLAALLLGLAFAGPRGCGEGSATHLVCVLDASASMGAELAGGSLRDRAVELVRERIGELSPRSKVTLIASGSRPALLAGPAAFPAEARAALADYAPSTARHELAPAVALGLQLSGDGAVLVVTDHFRPEAFPPEVELVSIGAPVANVALTHAARTRELDDEGREIDLVLLTVSAFTEGPVRRRLAITAGGETTTEVLELRPDERLQLELPVAPGTGAVVVALEADGLAIDDVAYLAPVPPRPLALFDTLDPRAARSLGLASGDTPARIDRLLELLPEVYVAEDAESAHLLLGHGERGGPRTWTLSIEGDLGLSAKTDDLVGPFLAERRHPLLVGLTLEGIVWSATEDHELEGVPLISAGDRPLLTESGTEDARHVHLNLDPYRSSLQRSPDWPILLANLAELRRAELPGLERANIAIGDSLVFHGDEPATYRVLPLLAEGADERTLPARDVLIVEDLDRPGLWSVARDGREVARCGVSFRDPEESDLRGLLPGQREAGVRLGETLAAFGPLETALLAVALLLVLLDWWFLRGLFERTRHLLTRGGGNGG